MEDLSPDPKLSPWVVSWASLDKDRSRPGLERCAIASSQAMVVHNIVTPAMAPAPHAHLFAQIALITRGEGILEIDGERHPVAQGSVSIIPAGAVHHLEAAGDADVENIDVFVPIRDDYAHLLQWMQPDSDRPAQQ